MKRGDDGASVAKGNECRIGVAPVDDHLYVGSLTSHEAAAEVRTDGEHHHRPLIVDRCGDLILGQQGCHLLERVGAIEAGHQFPGGSAAVGIVHRQSHAADVERRRVAEHQQLDDGWSDHHEATALVLQQGQELLDRQSQHLPESAHGYSSLSLDFRQTRLRNTVAMTARASMSGTITFQTLPARNTVCSTLTK